MTAVPRRAPAGSRGPGRPGTFTSTRPPASPARAMTAAPRKAPAAESRRRWPRARATTAAPRKAPAAESRRRRPRARATTAAPRKAPALRASARTSTGPPGKRRASHPGGPSHVRGSGPEGRDHLAETPHRLGAPRVREAHDRRLHAGLGELAVAAHLLLGRRRSLPLPGAARRHHPRRCQVRHLDLGRIALLRRAVLVEHGELVAHAVGVAAQVAGVGMAGGEPQGPLLARPAHHDRDALLQRPRVADGLP